jgi:hypothetical protein
MDALPLTLLDAFEWRKNFMQRDETMKERFVLSKTIVSMILWCARGMGNKVKRRKENQ